MDGVGVKLKWSGVELELMSFSQLRFNSYWFHDLPEEHGKKSTVKADVYVSGIHDAIKKTRNGWPWIITSRERKIERYRENLESHWWRDLILFVKQFGVSNALHHLALTVLCVPATTAPAERIHSQSGLLMRPHRNRLSKDMLSKLTFIKCNIDLLDWYLKFIIKIL